MQYANPLNLIKFHALIREQWLKCYGAQGNDVSPPAMAQSVPHLRLLQCYSRERHTTIDKGPKRECTL